MFVRTPADLGAVIRDRRKKLELDQAALARRIGVSRAWVIEIEHGHPRAELALVLRALDALDIRLAIASANEDEAPDRACAVDIDAIVAKAKTSEP